nr:hybrid sensor histidine kinase/response regulator [Aquabacterium terrae]
MPTPQPSTADAAAATTSEPSPGPPPPFVAVDCAAEVSDAFAATERHIAERRQVDERLRDAALRAALAALPTWGLCLAILTLPAVLALWLRHPIAALVTGALMLAIAALLWWLPQHTRHRFSKPGEPSPTRQRILALVSCAGLATAALPWLGATLGGAGETSLALLALACTVFAFAGAASLSPLPRLAQAIALLPLSPALAAASQLTGPARWAPLVGGIAASAVATAVFRLRHRGWRQNTRALIEQGARLRALEGERDAAWAADQEKSRFLAIASHDLRQPVHALGLFAATLHKRLQHSADEPLARNLMRSIDGLERSFNAMLDISRLDAGVMSPRLQTFPLRDMFRRLHMHYAGQAELAGLGLRFSPGGKSVTSDPQLLERIVGNLIQNAIKYTEHGGIVVVARSTSRFINLEIWDTGVGIAPALLPRVFEEFYQVGRGERDRTHGLGMGLAIVKRLASLLNHRLVVASRPGRGTMFRIGIPIGQLPGIQEDMAPADTLPMVATTPQMVLVIDDEEPIREGLRLLLEEWGYQAMTAADAQQAEHATQALEGHVDLVLSDLHLGDGPDGLEAIAAVRRLCGQEVPAILVTGDTAHDEIQRITASGHPVLFKPVQPRRLFEALRSSLN